MLKSILQRSPYLLAGMVFLVLAACGGGGVDGGTNPPSSLVAESAPAYTPLPLLSGCGWQKVFDPYVVNVAFPDTSAAYWLALVPNPALLGGQVELLGRYADARYFSYNTYDVSSAPNDALADYEIAPDAGAANPFRAETRLDPAIPSGGRYTVTLSFDAPVAPRAPNTLYAGDLVNLHSLAIPNAALALLVYRTYVPAEGRAADGGVGLPVVAVNLDGERYALAERADCGEQFNAALAALGAADLNALINDSDVPELPGGPDFPLATDPPGFQVFRGFVVGFFSNVHNRYLYALFSRKFGALYLVRGKAPAIPRDAAAGQLRYWSICQNEFVTQRVTGCVADHAATLDASGYYNVVVSDGADRPSNARPEEGFDWLSWGAWYDGEIIYRHMLPDPAFAQAIQRVDADEQTDAVMGDYFPVATYCDRATFEAAAGQTPAQVFEACRSSRP